jgi:hypothetical protein
MNSDRFIEAWRYLPTPTKWRYIAFAGLVVLLIVMLFSTSVSVWVSNRKDRAFEKREAAREVERQELILQREYHKNRADVFEVEAKLKELVIDAAGQRAETLLAEAERLDDEFKKEMDSIGAPVDIAERCRRICARLKLKPEDCGCN